MTNRSNPLRRVLPAWIFLLLFALSAPPAAAEKAKREIPEEAEAAMVKGGVFMKEAKDAAGYEKAAASFEKAAAAAPWWGDAHFNLGVAREAQGRFDLAIAAFRKAAETASKDEAKKIKRRIYALEAKSELAKDEDETKLIVPGKSLGKLRMGMSVAEARAAWPETMNYRSDGPMSSLSSENGDFIVSFDRGALYQVSLNRQDNSFKTRDGLRLGLSMAEAHAKREPTKTRRWASSSSTAFCYDDGLMISFYDNGYTSLFVSRPDIAMWACRD